MASLSAGVGARAAVLVFGLLLAAVSPPAWAGEEPADPTAERAQTVIDAIRAGDPGAAVKRLGNDAAAAALAARPELVHVLLDRAYRGDAALAAADPAARRTLVARLGSLADRVHGASPRDDRAAWALALSLALRERVGPPRGQEAWERIAALLVEVHEREPAEGAALSYAVTFLLEGACADADARHRLQTRADTLTRKALRAAPTSEALARSLGATYLWAARRLLPDQRKPAKQALRVALDALARPLRTGEPSLETATYFNAAVTLGKDTGFAFPDAYFTLPADALEGAVVFDVPLSSRWDVRTVAGTEETPGYTYVTQTDAAGRPVRQLLFRRYFWGSTYRFEDDDAVVNGDNVKKIVRGLQEMTAAQVFAPGAKTSKPAKHRLTRDLVGQRFEIVGTTRDEEPQPLRVHGFGVRGHRQATLVVLVYVHGAADGLGHEMEAVLDSLREPDE